LAFEFEGASLKFSRSLDEEFERSTESCGFSTLYGDCVEIENSLFTLCVIGVIYTGCVLEDCLIRSLKQIPKPHPGVLRNLARLLP
jgi:hypothetical protein